MASAFASGADSRACNSRAPAPVTVRSMATKRLPDFSPDVDRTSSNDARLAASIVRIAPVPVLRGGMRRGLRPICVRSMYLSTAPIAASSGRENVPKPASSLTPRCDLRSRSPDRLSKNAAGTGVVLAPASSAQRKMSMSANKVSLARISLGAIRTSSPGKSGPMSSEISNSPVEISMEARASFESAANAGPDPLPARKTLVRKFRALASSKASSVNVPGVTSRTTSRLTTALEPRLRASAGSSNCSQTATR